jgi:hypothetical protein
MTNHYEVAEIVEIGRAQDVILGSVKDLPIYPDSPSQIDRQFETADDE